MAVLDMTIEAVVRHVELAADEPLRERQIPLATPCATARTSRSAPTPPAPRTPRSRRRRPRRCRGRGSSAWSTNDGGGGNVRPSASKDSIGVVRRRVMSVIGPPSVLRGGGQAISGGSRTIRAERSGRRQRASSIVTCPGVSVETPNARMRVEPDHPGDDTLEVLGLLDLTDARRAGRDVGRQRPGRVGVPEPDDEERVPGDVGGHARRLQGQRPTLVADGPVTDGGGEPERHPVDALRRLRGDGLEHRERGYRRDGPVARLAGGVVAIRRTRRHGRGRRVRGRNRPRVGSS